MSLINILSADNHTMLFVVALVRAPATRHARTEIGENIKLHCDLDLPILKIWRLLSS